MKAFVLASVCLFSVLSAGLAQFSNGRVLDPPNPQLCAQRIIHEKTPDGKGYFFSWRDPNLKGVEEDWLSARNYCRRRCMDSVSLETSLENEWIKQRVVTENFVSGARIEAQDFDGNWHTARVVEVDNDDREVLIKFERTGKIKSAVVGAEEWISMNSTRLRQRATSKPVPVFELEEKCLARWSGPRKFPGTIKKVLGNNAYEVLFDDGYVKNVRAVHMVKLVASPAVAENDVKARRSELATTQTITATSTPVKALSTDKISKEDPAEKPVEAVRRSTSAQVKDWPLLDMSKIDLASLNLPQIPRDGEWTCHWVNDQPIGREGFLIVGEHRKPTVIVDDWRLPSGWVKHMYQRSNLLGKWDVILVSPIGKRFRSKADLKQFLEEKGQVYNPDIYDFSIHRRRAKDINAYAFTSGYTPHQPYKTKVNTSANASASNTSDLLSTSVTTPSAAQYIETPVAGAAPPAELLNATVDIKSETEEKKPDLSTLGLSSDSPKSSTILEDGYAYVGGLKVQIVDNLFRCPEVGCSKNFRKENHLQIHIKHYHQNLTKLLGACPKMQELAEKRTHTLPDPNEPQPKNQIPNQEFFAKMHQQDMQNSRSRGKSSFPDSPDLIGDIKKETTMDLKQEIKNEISDTENVTLGSVNMDTTINTTADSSSMLPLSSADDSALNVSNTSTKRSRFSPTKRVSGARKSNRQRTTRRYLTAAHSSGATIPSTPVTSDNHFGVSDFEETRHSFNATPDAKLLETRKRKIIAAPVTPIDSPITADSGSSSIQHISATDPEATNRPEYIKENGQLIKIVRMRQEEIINCVCGFYEEDGLMIQCELCLCWQHGSCNEIFKESEVPEKYICSICRNPQRARESMLYKHDQDWLYEGKLPVGNYHTNSGSIPKRFDYLKLTHTLTGNLLEIKDFIHSLRLKTNVAGNRCHPKLYLWANKWDDVKGDAEGKVNTETKPADDDKNNIKVEEGSVSTPAVANIPNIPQPEAAIDTDECQQRLLEHIKVQQSNIAARLDLIEADVARIEKEDELDELKGSNSNFNKEILATFIKDMEAVRQLAKLNCLEHKKKAVAVLNARPL
ncbi:uncharacterized protein LOC119675955 [Teleopsis dalmanni]|uniref:uncharacterized protein LOC119675955 n=1 Tax=Teleopsis dalmanni TaxID=139649 RepID=UPI0018CCD682|nr:uncharacterized protein LOC119675955 [Teleopsis dalmanni]